MFLSLLGLAEIRVLSLAWNHFAWTSSRKLRPEEGSRTVGFLFYNLSTPVRAQSRNISTFEKYSRSQTGRVSSHCNSLSQQQQQRTAEKELYLDTPAATSKATTPGPSMFYVLRGRHRHASAIVTGANSVLRLR